MDKVRVYMCLHIASIKTTAGEKLGFSVVCFPFLLACASVLPNNYIAACSIALCSATEKNEMGGYVTVPCSSKMTQHSSTANWIKFW